MTDPLAIMEMIERLACNPSVDADKLAKILDVQERLLDRNARIAFDHALGQAQAKLPVITRDGRIIVKEKDAKGERNGKIIQDTPYAKWEKIMPIVGPILHRNGLGLTHRISTAPDGRVRVTAVLKGWGHTDDSCYFDLSADTTGSKNNAQGWASSVSYAKRHTACAVLNIVTRNEDDDAQSSGRLIVVGDPLLPADLERLIEFAAAVECPEPHLLKHLNRTKPKGHPDLAKIADLPASRLDETLDALRSYESNKRARDESAKQGEARP